MNKVKPYIVALIIVMLGIAPLLSLPANANTAQEEFCSCCQGPCHGCCCSNDKKEEAPSKSENRSDCSCKISTIPLIPEQKIESTLKTDHQLESLSNDYKIDNIFSNLELNHKEINHSPPLQEHLPIYILNSAFLI